MLLDNIVYLFDEYLKFFKQIMFLKRNKFCNQTYHKDHSRRYALSGEFLYDWIKNFKFQL